jgi:predicted dehydrogenase
MQNRRAFIKGTTAFGAVLAAAPTVGLGQEARRVFKFALVGCGGRGRGAAGEITKAAQLLGCEAKMVGAADYFRDKAAAACKAHGCDEKFAFGGANGYKEIMNTDAEIVLLCAPPFFRPVHAEACLKAKKHIFAEKPVATDPPGIRRFLKVVEGAKAANVALLSGTCHRHNYRALRMIGPVRNGIIGEIRGGIVYRCHGGMSVANYIHLRKPGQAFADYMAASWYHFHELSGDHLTEQAVHEIDLANWFIGKLPKQAMGIGARHQRAIGNGYDCFGIDYDYGNGLHVHAVARQINGCFDRCCATVTGTTGQIDVLGSKILRPDGKSEPFPFDEEAVKGRDQNMYVAEHYDLLSGLLKGELLNEGEQIAMATATGVLGTIAAYTGQMVRMSDLLENEQSPFYSWKNAVSPEDFESGSVPELPEGKTAAPVPGSPEKTA